MIKSTFYMLLVGEEYKCYENALLILKCESLEQRRVQLCASFAIKASKDSKFSSWFCHKENTRPLRGNTKSKFKAVNTRTRKYENSPLPYMTNLLNQ